MQEPLGMRSSSPMMKVSIPPARGPKSLVIKRTDALEATGTDVGLSSKPTSESCYLNPSPRPWRMDHSITANINSDMGDGSAKENQVAGFKRTSRNASTSVELKSR